VRLTLLAAYLVVALQEMTFFAADSMHALAEKNFTDNLQ
jgi:hypothetical protein